MNFRKVEHPALYPYTGLTGPLNEIRRSIVESIDPLLHGWERIILRLVDRTRDRQSRPDIRVSVEVPRSVSNYERERLAIFRYLQSVDG
jgi:hypothetical protein